MCVHSIVVYPVSMTDMVYNSKTVQGYGYAAYQRAEGPSDNPYEDGTKQNSDWDRGYWQAHNDAADAAPIEDSDGPEAAYGDYWDVDAVSQGYYDDDPSPYDGNYSEM